MTASHTVRFGYKASAEQFGPRDAAGVLAAGRGRRASTIVAISDHFQPWRHHGGHSPAALPWLGALGGRRERAAGHERADADAALRARRSSRRRSRRSACLSPGRVFLGVGTGEAMNETPRPASGPGRKERRLRLAEAIELIRRLWREERVDFEGEYYKTSQATIYDRPDEPVPIYVAASRAAGGQARRPRRRRLHLHQRQGPRALPRPARRRSREGAEEAGRDHAQIRT